MFKADDDYLENEEKYKELKKGKFFVVVCVCVCECMLCDVLMILLLLW